MNIQKVLLFSSMVSVNMIIWYELLGMKFLLGVMMVVVFLLLQEGDHDKRGYFNRGRGGRAVRGFKKHDTKKKLER